MSFLMIQGLRWCLFHRAAVDRRRTRDSLVGKPQAEWLVFAKDESEALVDDVIAPRFKVAAVMLQRLQHVAVQPDRDLLALFFGLFGNYCWHDVYSLLMNSF